MIGEKRNILGAVLLAGGMCLANAQNAVSITGKVTDKKSGAAIAGAKLTLAGTPSVIATSGADGSYTLSGSAVGIDAALRNAAPEMSFKGNVLSFNVAGNNTPISVDVYNLKSEHVRNLVRSNASAGSYSVNTAPVGLAGGLYFVRAVVGKHTASFKMSTVGAGSRNAGLLANASYARTGLAKTALEPIDSLIVSKEGYKPFAMALYKYTGIFPIVIAPKLPAGDLKIVSERSMQQVDWGSNVRVDVWTTGTLLTGDYKTEPFEGPQSWYVTSGPDQIYSGWGFAAPVPEDMSAWATGSMHIAVKGTVTSLGVTMASTSQAGGFSKKINMVDFGYKPDNMWHDAFIPMTAFEGTDFSQIELYCGLVYPVDGDTAGYDPTLFYQVDDIYWTITQK
jgi:hypothetical protein